MGSGCSSSSSNPSVTSDERLRERAQRALFVKSRARISGAGGAAPVLIGELLLQACPEGLDAALDSATIEALAKRLCASGAEGGTLRLVLERSVLTAEDGRALPTLRGVLRFLRLELPGVAITTPSSSDKGQRANAKAAESRLLPPPPEVQLWLKGKYDYGDRPLFQTQIKAALPWLKEALAEAWRSAAIKAEAKALLRVRDFVVNLGFAEVFDELQEYCSTAARVTGAEMKAYCEREALVDALGDFALPEHPAFASNRRLDNAEVVGLPLPPRLNGELDGEWERAVAHIVRLVALGVDEAFQTVCKKITQAHGGSFKATAIKGHARIMGKAMSDHRCEALPRPALNIDTVRNALTFDDAAQLKAAARDLCAELGGTVARLKNGFAPEVDGDAQLHYRTVMVNWVFEPGQTYGELACAAAPIWRRYFEAPPDPTEPWGRWRTHAARALACLRGAVVSSRPVRFVCETQLLLRPYLEGRLRMHLLYKVVRAADAHKLHSDFAAGGATARWAKGVTYDGEQRAAVVLAIAKVDKWAADAGELLAACALDGELKALRELLKRGADVDKATLDTGATPLWMAAQGGHADCICALLERGADVDKPRAADGTTPLYLAAVYGHGDCVRTLLEQGAEVDKAKTDDGTTALYMAAQNGHADCVLALLEQGADADRARSDDGTTVLYMAAQNGYADCVRALLERRATVDKTRVAMGSTPLYMAAQNGFVDCVRALLERGADVDKARTDNGCTPLYFAAENRHVACVRALLERGADVDKANQKRQTPINIAAYQGRASVVAVLIAAKADLTKPDQWGDSPLENAVDQGHEECGRTIRRALLRVLQ